MKLTRIVKIRVNLSRLSASLISALLISSILTPILEPVQTFLTPKNKLSFFPFTLYFSSFTKARAKVFNISSSSSSLSLSEVMSISSPLISATNCVLIALISFIMKFYLLFRVNFLYSKVVFHLIRVNLMVNLIRVNLMVNFMDR